MSLKGGLLRKKKYQQKHQAKIFNNTLKSLKIEIYYLSEGMRGLFWHEGRQEMHCGLLNVFDSSAWELRTPQKKPKFIV